VSRTVDAACAHRRPDGPATPPALAGLTLILSLALGGCAAWPGRPAATAATGAQDSAASDASQGPAALAVELVVDAPDEAARTLLARHLDLARLQRLRADELPDDNEWSRLIGAAPDQARELLQTEGYFDAEVRVRRETGVPPRVRVTVEPGARTRIAAFDLDWSGALASAIARGDPQALAVRDALQAQARALIGEPLVNARWATAKQLLLARLRAEGYASTRIEDSLADVDTTAHEARLSVRLDSGPLYLAGALRIQGLQAHDEETVRHLAGFGPGAALTEARLLDYQERLQKAGLFDRATVSFEPDPARADDTPVLVSVGESALRQLTLGLGYSSGSGARTSAELTHRRPFGWAVTAYNKLQWGVDSQAWSGDFYTHPGEDFYRELIGVQIARERSDSDVVLSQRLRLGRTQDTQRWERLYFLEWLRSRQSDALSVETATAVSGNYHLVWRELDSVLLPTRGIALSLQGGAGLAFSRDGGNGPFTRLYARAIGYLPLGASWYGQARLEAGEVIKRGDVVVPDALGFRAGGDESVRGYGYRELAPTDSDGTIHSGMQLLTASLELARPVSARLPSVWGAVFVDAGRAVDSWSRYTPAVGWGVGVRWRSPLGPLRVDWAYAEELRRARLHLSLGITY
jgi:translocation and assembly module TamA